MLRSSGKVILYILLLSVVTSTAQEIEFSQFNKIPLMQNPANTGMGKGYNRGNIMYHNQHPTFGNAFKTMYFSVDAPVFSHKMQRKHALVGAGMYFYKDTQGDSQLSNVDIGFSMSSNINFDYYNKGSVGLQYAYIQKSYTTTGLQWDNQFNGTVYDPSLPSKEFFSGEKLSMFNLSAGLLWQHFSRGQNLSGIDQGSFQVGYGIFNLMRPPQSVFQNEDRLFVRHVLHAKSLFAIQEKHFGVAPSGYFMKQGPHTEFAIGSQLLYFIKSDTKYTGFIKEAYVGISLHYRNSDALIPGIIIKLQDFNLGISYDYGIGKLNTYNNGAGGFEISIQFNDTYGTLFNQGNKHVINSSRQQRHL